MKPNCYNCFSAEIQNGFDYDKDSGDLIHIAELKGCQCLTKWQWKNGGAEKHCPLLKKKA